MAPAKIQDSAQPWMTLASTYEEDVSVPQTLLDTTELHRDSLNAPYGQWRSSNATEPLNYEVDCCRNAAEEPFLTGPTTNESGSTLPSIMNRPVSPCRDCGISFATSSSWISRRKKDSHAKFSNHGAYSCKFSNCGITFVIQAERDAHEQTPHIAGHGRTLTTTPNDCVECEETFLTKANLLRHAKETQHQPYRCECGALFSRLDVLNRHLESFNNEDPKHPCKYCKLHRGPNGFRRLDHLKQHIRNYHHLEMDDEIAGASSRLKFVIPVCPHPECPQYRNEAFKQLPRKSQVEAKPFNSQFAYTKHMRDEHNECTFPCDVSGCARTGRRGYFREKDLLNHRRQEHPDAARYDVAKRELRLRCTEPGCNALLDPSSMTYHMGIHM
ncbi:hypothetical protein N431DRAFT_403854 [Stipitochalara longipes BDJ]|nr:hypothetical protein N431DRAFT_403854 [Stipitochalara longipes BDJ]